MDAQPAMEGQPSTRSIIEPLFAKAKATDEFEYACALLRIRGMSSAGWEPLAESDALLDDLTALVRAPLRFETQVRLSLLAYCHAMEMSVPYDVLGNMLRVCLGDRYKIDVCEEHFQLTHPNRIAFPKDKIKLIKEWANEAGFPDVGALFDRFFENKIRNAFFHSDYVLHDGTINLTSGDAVSVAGTLTPSIPIKTELETRINAALEFVGGVTSLMRTSLRAYTEAKTVKGRMGADGSRIDVNFDVEPERGLVGFHGVSS